ncbi:hypothetical protein CBR_g48824 [Chara braunii]|uniref:Uncharacterized protein n=1 Tax=Chara braunii TaxID=69332 RepID=A0A388M3G4_CHABU|nr:hypothetical protein CBR_g48824 [Chara braunii]|eukprot:GBG89114.1 hypothetical protein CBR_g48824 [Chara braunii]
MSCAIGIVLVVCEGRPQSRRVNKQPVISVVFLFRANEERGQRRSLGTMFAASNGWDVLCVSKMLRNRWMGCEGRTRRVSISVLRTRIPAFVSDGNLCCACLYV